jgi:hypothetical protein
VPASSFTPINRPAQQLLTPQSSTSTHITRQSPQANRERQRGKRHHPAITEYLGLGVETEPLHRESYAPARPPTPPTPPRSLKRTSRRRKLQDGDITAKDGFEKSKPAKQRRVSDGLRITKRRANKTAKQTDETVTSEPVSSAQLSSSLPASRMIEQNCVPRVPRGGAFSIENHYEHLGSNYQGQQSWTPQQVGNAIEASSGNQRQLRSQVPARGLPQVTPFSNQEQRLCIDLNTAATRTSDDHSPGLVAARVVGQDARENEVHRAFEFDSQDTMVDEGIEDIFNMIDTDNMNFFRTTNDKLPTSEPPCLDTSEVDFTDGDLFLLTAVPTNDTSSPMRPKSTIRNVVTKSGTDANTTTDLTQEPGLRTSRRRSRKFVSPKISESSSLITKEPATKPEEEQKPIVRPPFPTPVRDRSPIIGLSPNLLLRTCFRIGEAIQQANHATKNGQKIMFELYARILSSQRNDVKQDFVFRDLFHEKPPHIKGVYDAVIWKSVRLYNYDSERLLGKGRICRCIGTMKRDGKEWVMTVLNIWEAKWEDVAWVEGIVRV